MKVGAHPLAGFDALSEYHHSLATTKQSKTRKSLSRSSFLPRSLPLRRFPSLEEPLTSSEDASSLVTLRSQGFAPSQRFAPLETSQAYFILVPSMGFPLQRYDQNPKPYVLVERRSPHDVLHNAQQSEITSKPVCPVDCPYVALSPSRRSTSDPVPTRAPGVS
jgi:hypothetical protein